MLEGTQEKTWEYDCDFLFNSLQIVKFTITDHYQKKHGNVIDNELICEMVNKLDGEDLESEPRKEGILQDVYVWNLTHRSRRYRLIFWFKDGTTNHLWIRNCYPINPPKTNSN